MTAGELLNTLKCGEDSRHQFKRAVKSEAELAEDFVAFSNGDGGEIFVGVADDGSVTGLTAREIAELNKRISNAASQWVRPEPQITTENIATETGVVVIIRVLSGISKPYQDKDGNFWVKKGADNRRALAREELQRMFQRSGLVHADILPVDGTSEKDINRIYFDQIFQEEFGKLPVSVGVPFQQLLRNLKLFDQDGRLNIAGTLLFTTMPHRHLPAFIIKAVVYPGERIGETSYLDSRDIQGPFAMMFDSAVQFLRNNMRHLQAGQSVNSTGKPEIPTIIWEELISNALVHRDYFTSAPIRIFIFSDRVEIISPGHLPNGQTIESIQSGISNMRNPVLASFAAKILPYRGLGNGIIRSMQVYPHIEFIDDRDGNQFKAIIKRPDKDGNIP